ncbi:MAG: hypothetical protein IT370_26715 [Deltaproteobacteria bacterium]|nr:hypothetical protein [Deltaproteobacteria bacterium]
MGAYQFRIWAVALVMLAGCKRPGGGGRTPAREVDAALAAPGLTLTDVWVAGESARDLPRFRPGETLVVGFGVRAQGALEVTVRVATGAAVLVEGHTRADIPDGGIGDRATSQLAVTLPTDAAAGPATMTLTVRDQAGRVGTATEELVVVPPRVADVTATGVLTGARLVDAHLRSVGVGMPGQLLALLPAGELPKGTRFELTFLVVPPDGTQPTAPMGVPVVREVPDLSFQLPTSVSPLYGLMVRALGPRGAVIGSARVRFAGDVPDDERDHLSTLRLTKFQLRGGPGLRALRAGLLRAGERVAISARVGGYKVAGRRPAGDAGAPEFAIGLTMAVRLRDRDGKLVAEQERLAVREGTVVTAPPRLLLDAEWTVPASARGRGMLEVEIEDLVGGTVSSVFREVDVVEAAP